MGITHSCSYDTMEYNHNHDNPSVGLSPALMRRRRGMSSDSASDFGWFEDFESPSLRASLSNSDLNCPQPIQQALTLPAPASEAPLYVLEEPLETQKLWYNTAGKRPVQPADERAHFEQLWSQNFEQSEIQENKISQPFNNTSQVSSPKKADHIYVAYRGKSSFSNSVSKSFPSQLVSSMTIQAPYFRIVRNLKTEEVYAEFLVMVSLGGRGSVTFGIWKRYSSFCDLAKNIALLDEHRGMLQQYSFKNTLLSWQCVVDGKKWFKCLDKEYLSLKCFLIERFMQDLLFETPNSNIISDFLGLA
jgi:hypothetical protein